MPEGVRVIVLGSGTSAGVPAIGCQCATCTSDDPRDTRLRTSAAVCWRDDGQDRVVLIDASPDLRQQVLRAGITRCDGIVFTHHHVDHTFGLDEVRRFNAVMKAPIDLWGEQRTIENLERVYAHIFRPEDNVNDSFIARLQPHEVEPGDRIEVFGLQFEALRLEHGNLPILGWRIDIAGGGPQPPGWPLAWCTDVSKIPDATRARLTGLGTLVLDLLRDRPHATHLSRSRAVEEAARIGAGQTWFVHMAHQVRHAQLDAELPSGMALAWDGLELPARA